MARNYFQPSAKLGFFQPGTAVPVCQRDNVACVLVGSNDFAYRCPQCGWQYKFDGTARVDNVLQAPPLVLPPNNPADESRVDYSEPPFNDL